MHSTKENANETINGSGESSVKPKHTATKLRKKKKHAIACSSVEHFALPKIDYFAREPRKFYEECKEVATYHDNSLCLGSIPDKITIPKLKRNLSLLCDNNSIDYKRSFLGANLYRNYQEYKPMSLQNLDDATPCFLYCKQMGVSISSASNERKLIISPRHHIVDMIMSLFNDDGFSMICTHFNNGSFLFSLDSINKQAQKSDRDASLDKIVYSGTALEKELTHRDTKPYFSIVEGLAGNNVRLLLRCEMDAINEVKNIYTELKCYTRVNLHNIHHRRKLLKTWIQISLIPQSDLIIGLRDQGGILRDLQWFSRDGLYADLSNPSLPRNKRYRNFNPNVAVAWFNHCANTITQKIANCVENPAAPESFLVKIDTKGSIRFYRQNKTPRHASLMIQKYSPPSL